MGGDDSEDNLVDLPAKAHYIAHLLLTKIYPQNKSLHNAFFCMSRSSSDQDRTYITSSRYAKMKESRAFAQSIPCRIDEIEFSSYANAAKHYGVCITTAKKWAGIGKSEMKHRHKCKIDGVEFPSKSAAARHYSVDPNTITYWLQRNNGMSIKRDTTCIVDGRVFESVRAAAREYDVTAKVVRRWIDKFDGKSQTPWKK